VHTNSFWVDRNYHATFQHYTFVQQHVVLALKSDDYVDHPLLDKLRECSTDPHWAAEFFLRILHRFHQSRSALRHNGSHICQTSWKHIATTFHCPPCLIQQACSQVTHCAGCRLGQHKCAETTWQANTQCCCAQQVLLPCLTNTNSYGTG